MRFHATSACSESSKDPEGYVLRWQQVGFGIWRIAVFFRDEKVGEFTASNDQHDNARIRAHALCRDHAAKGTA